MRSNDFLSQNESVLIVVARAIDAGAVALVGMLAYFWTHETWDLPSFYQVALVIAFFFTIFLFPAFDLYSSWRGRPALEHIRVIAGAVLTLMICLVVMSALSKTTAWFSRAWFGTWALSCVAVIFGLKRVLMIVLRELRGRGWNQRNIVIYGAGRLGCMVALRLKEADWAGFRIVSFFDDAPDQALDNLKTAGLDGAVQGPATDLDNYLRDNDVRELWLALPLRAEERVRDLLFSLRHSTVSIRFIPNLFSFKLFLGLSVTDVAGVPVVNVNSSPMSGLNRVIKDLEDRVLAFLILVLVSPIMALIAAAIRLESKGPIIYKQERHGWDGKIIKVYKFRSMSVMDDSTDVRQATKGDSRITKVGAFIRRTSLDELPQFFNVLQGRMSIVGPRPHALSHNEYYKDKVENYFQRHKVKPGITGLAQINGFRGETDTLEKMEKRVAYDLQYIQNWSVGLDLKIIALTVFRVFADEKAY